jgi:hypothetical protein
MKLPFEKWTGYILKKIILFLPKCDIMGLKYVFKNIYLLRLTKIPFSQQLLKPQQI